MLHRRQFLQQSAALTLLAAGWNRRGWCSDTPAEELPPVRAITRAPGHHWFGYYDKLQFDPTNTKVLGMKTNFEHRSPKPDDEIEIGYVDLANNDQWIRLGATTAWCWQQGCMLQWLPGSSSKVIWNERGSHHYQSRIYDLSTGDSQLLNSAIYTLAPDGKSAITTDFRRLNDVRPGYGYSGLADPYKDELTPQASGIWKIDLQTGTSELLVSIAQVAALGPTLPDMQGAKHWFNHLLINPDGSRFTFLHRWKPVNSRVAFRTRMLTARRDGSDLFVIDPSGETSHFVWRDPETITAWTKPPGKPFGFYHLRDRTAEVEAVGAGVMTVNGHNTYLTGIEAAPTAWILNDTYPDQARLQHPYLFHVPTGQRYPLGHFHSPPAYTGEWRCDNHPRSSPNGRLACIDSPHGGNGRQLYLIDLEPVLQLYHDPA